MIEINAFFTFTMAVGADDLRQDSDNEYRDLAKILDTGAHHRRLSMRGFRRRPLSLVRAEVTVRA